ncbi:MAG TPA: glycoside hydrolase family 9 protein [Armatimonadota bacterium]|jgi:hypothetical protein
MRLAHCLVVSLLVVAQGRPAAGMSVAEFRGLPDDRVAVRTSLGLRSAWATDATHVRVTLGASITDACGKADSYRILSFQDPAYAYERFVRPEAAEARRVVELPGPKGCPLPRFERAEVTLTLLRPLRPGKRYFVIAQGTEGLMVTGGHTAQSFTYRPGAKEPPRDGSVDRAVLGLRRVEPVGPRLLMLEIGPCSAPDAATDVSAYHVRVAGLPVAVTRIGRRSCIDTYLPVGWPFQVLPMHEIYLEIARPVKDGDQVDVELDPRLTTAEGAASLRFGDRNSLSRSLKVNQLGYLASTGPRRAYLGRWMGSFPEGGPPGANPALFFGAAPSFKLCDAGTRRPAFTGSARLIHVSGVRNEGRRGVDHSGENVYLLDFTAFHRPGRYFLSVPGVGRSTTFEVRDDLYRRAFRAQAAGVFAQRCGIALGPPYSEWRRIACHHAGILPTTQSRLAPHEIEVLSTKVDTHRPQRTAPDPRLLALDHDPDLAARWPLDGSLRSVIPAAPALRSGIPEPPFSPDNLVYPGSHKVLGPTLAGTPLNATAPGLELPWARGCTVALWFRYARGDQFDGALVRLRKGQAEASSLALAASWGVLRASSGAGGQELSAGRVGDGRWHHLAVALSPSRQGRRELSLYLDGRPMGETLAPETPSPDTLELGFLTGPEAAGKQLSDVRLYGRRLDLPEIATLAVRRGEEALKIRAYGGHHDAGDYNPRSHLDVAQILMDAYETAPGKFKDGQLAIPERANGIPDILDEAYWALRLWIGLQDANGGVFDGTESAGDPNFIQTVELDDRGDYAYAKDAVGSFSFAGAMAQASRLWRSLGRAQEAAGFLDRARRAYAWAEGHRPADLSLPAAYGTYHSPRTYAAAELLLTTGESRFRQDFAASCVWSRNPQAEVGEYNVYDQSRGAWAYARVPAAKADPTLQHAVRSALLRTADTFIADSSRMPYSFLRHPGAPISWGTGAQLHYAMPVAWAWALTRKATYRDWLLRSCDNTLGANPLGISYIVGLGTRTVRAPLHNSRYGHQGEVAAGMQANGPMENPEGYRVRESFYPAPRADFASLYSFVDCHFSIAMDEGLVRSQAEAMALFGLLQP